MAESVPRYRDSAVLYLHAVLRGWVALVGGALLSFAVVALGAATTTDVPRWAWVAAILLGFIGANFLAFHHLNLEHAQGLRRGPSPAVISAVDAAMSEARRLVRPFAKHDYLSGGQQTEAQTAALAWARMTYDELRAADPALADRFGVPPEHDHEVFAHGLPDLRDFMAERMAQLSRIRDAQ